MSRLRAKSIALVLTLLVTVSACGRLGFHRSSADASVFADATPPIDSATASDTTRSIDGADSLDTGGATDTSTGSIDGGRDGTDSPNDSGSDSYSIDSAISDSSARGDASIADAFSTTDTPDTAGVPAVRIVSPVPAPRPRGSWLSVTGDCRADVTSVTIDITGNIYAPVSVTVPCTSGRFEREQYIRAFFADVVLTIVATADSGLGSDSTAVNLEIGADLGSLSTNFERERLALVTNRSTFDIRGGCAPDAVLTAAPGAFVAGDCSDGSFGVAGVTLSPGPNLREIDFVLGTGEQVRLTLDVYYDNVRPTFSSTPPPGGPLNDNAPAVTMRPNGVAYGAPYDAVGRAPYGYCIVAADPACTDIRAITTCVEGASTPIQAYVPDNATDTTFFGQVVDRAGNSSVCFLIGTYTESSPAGPFVCDLTIAGPTVASTDVQMGIDFLGASRATFLGDGELTLCLAPDLVVTCPSDNCGAGPMISIGAPVTGLRIVAVDPARPPRFLAQGSVDRATVFQMTDVSNIVVDGMIVDADIADATIFEFVRTNVRELARIRAQGGRWETAIHATHGTIGLVEDLILHSPATSTRSALVVLNNATINRMTALNFEVSAGTAGGSTAFGVGRGFGPDLGPGTIGRIAASTITIRPGLSLLSTVFSIREPFALGGMTSSIVRMGVGAGTAGLFWSLPLTALDNPINPSATVNTLMTTGNTVCTQNGTDFSDLGFVGPTVVSNGSFEQGSWPANFPWGDVGSGPGHANAPFNLQAQWGGPCP